MTDSRWTQIGELFEAALEIEPPARASFLLEHSPDDPELREEVASLLEAHENTGTFDRLVDATGESTVSRLLRGPRPGEVIDGYRILRQIGRGGMGTVYLTERADPALRQQVALKILHLGLDSDELLRRFLAERQILASLQHVNIALLLDGGATEDGLPYFTMEYVDGRPIDVYCEEEGLSEAERIALVLRVCDAVEFAHQQGVVHRDLKPGNILVREDGVPKVLDFGIAKLVEADGGSTLHQTETRTGHRRLTLEYASPEQVGGGPVTPASDVYSLGVLLHRLLAGRPPLETSGLTPAEVERRMHAGIPPPGLGEALDTVLLSALDPDPARRPPTAGALAGRLRQASSGTATRSGWAFGGRRAGSAVAALVLLAAGAGGVAWATRGSPETATAGTAAADDPGQARPAGAESRPQILWVDDRPENNRREIDVLWEQGFEVITVPSTDEALRLYRPGRFHGVISDMARSEGGEYHPEAGLTVLRALKRVDPDVRLVFYTNPVNVTHLRERMLEEGAAGIPTTTEELVRSFEDTGG